MEQSQKLNVKNWNFLFDKIYLVKISQWFYWSEATHNWNSKSQKQKTEQQQLLIWAITTKSFWRWKWKTESLKKNEQLFKKTISNMLCLSFWVNQQRERDEQLVVISGEWNEIEKSDSTKKQSNDRFYQVSRFQNELQANRSDIDLIQNTSRRIESKKIQCWMFIQEIWNKRNRMKEISSEYW